MNRMHKLVTSLIFVLTASVASLAVAQTTDTTSPAAKFRSEEQTMQQESTSMPPSAPVDRTAAPQDPIPKATTKAQEKARFNAEENAMQVDSTSMPPSAPVSKATPPADPNPRATTKSAKEARFANQERIMQEESTP
jgi:hypothetical protein